MTAEELMTGVLIGSMLIVLGVVPRWFQSLTEEVRNFGDSLSSPFAVRRKYETVNGKYEQPLWLAVIGLGLIAICVMGYF
jgi:hypothetical protein